MMFRTILDPKKSQSWKVSEIGPPQIKWDESYPLLMQLFEQLQEQLSNSKAILSEPLSWVLRAPLHRFLFLGVPRERQGHGSVGDSPAQYAAGISGRVTPCLLQSVGLSQQSCSDTALWHLNCMKETQ